MASSEIKTLVLSLLIIGFSSCSKLDIGGFFNSTSDADKRFAESMEWNASHPQKVISISDSVYYIHAGGDSHIGETAALESLLNLSKNPQIAALFIAGDVTTGKLDGYDSLRALFNRTDSVNVFMTTGNHDLYFSGWDTWIDYFGSACYTLAVNTPAGSDLFVFLDSGSGTLGKDQFNWLETTLENDRDSYRHCVVITHLNFFRNGAGMSTNPSVEEIGALLDLFAENNVNMVITGHDHDQYVESFGNNTYLTMDALVKEPEERTFLRLAVYPDSLSYEFVGF